MLPHLKKSLPTGCRALLLLCAIALGTAIPVWAQVNQTLTNNTWKMLYGVTDAQLASGTWLAADDDGDGVSNGAEIASGTNPFRPNSTLRVTSMSINGSNVSLTFPTEALKNYVVQATTSLASVDWQPLSPLVTANGTGNPVTVTFPSSSGGPFYRILVQDLDSDGDGIADWVENVLGYNPAAAMTNGITNDATAINGLVGQNVVTLSATQSATTQPSENTIPTSGLGEITITRGGYLLFNTITVPITRSGTAVFGVDYLLSGNEYSTANSSVTFPVGAKSVVIHVVPLYNPSRTASGTVTVTAQAGGGYTVGTPSSASVTLNPSGLTAGTGLVGQYYSGSNATYNTNTSNFGGLNANNLASGFGYSYNSGSHRVTIVYSGSPSAPLNIGDTVYFTVTDTNSVLYSPVTLYSGTIANLYDGAYKVTDVSGGVGSGTVEFQLAGKPFPTSGGSGTCFFSPGAAPALTRLDSTVDYTWGTGLPTNVALPTSTSDNWAARFDAYIDPGVGNDGNYNFRIQADDGARVYVNNVLVADAWVPGSTTNTWIASGNVALTGGTRVPIRVEYYELNWAASVTLQWKKSIDSNYVSIPSANIYPDATSSNHYWTAQYWNNTGFYGLPRFADYPTAVVENWGTGVPSQTLPSVDDFSVRWEGYIYSVAGGTYNFQITGDDTATFYLDTNNDGDFLDAGETLTSTGSTAATSGAITLAANTRYKARVEFADHSGTASVNLGWRLNGTGSFVAINASTVQTSGSTLGVYRDATSSMYGWWASYYPNLNFTDPPLYSVQDTSSSAIFGSGYSYGLSRPGGSNIASSGGSSGDGWGSKFDTYVKATSGANTYNFRVLQQAGDNVRVLFNGTQQILTPAQVGPSGTITSATYSVALTANQTIHVQVEHYNVLGNAQVTLQWSVGVGSNSFATIPASSLFQDTGGTIAGVPVQYFPNSAYYGNPLLTGVLTTLDVASTGGVPSQSITTPDFSVAWEGYLQPSATGTHSFDIQADDRARVYLDVDRNGTFGAPETIIDAWTPGSSATTPIASGNYTLTAGLRYKLRVEFADAGGPAVCKLRWISPSAASAVGIPWTNLYVDATSPQTGLAATYYPNSTLTAPTTPPYAYTIVENGNPGITFDFGSGNPDPAVPLDNFTVRWTGQVLPQYSETYYFDVRSDDGCKLYVNNQLIVSNWANTSGKSVGTIDLQAGVRYDIVLEYFENTGAAEAHLSWYSASQAKQIIPTSRLFPTMTLQPPVTVVVNTTGGGAVGTATVVVGSTNNIALGQTVTGTNIPPGTTVIGINAATGTITLSNTLTQAVTPGTALTFATPAAPPVITSGSTLVALLNNGTYSFTLTASNGGGNFTSTTLPPGLSLSSVGVLSGTPTQAGHYQFTVTASNTVGSGSQVIDMDVIGAGGKVTKDLFTTATGFAAFASNPTSFSDVTVTALDDTTLYPDNSGQRMRGYIIPQTTGNYYFWLAANNAAELWISNDDQIVNKVRRAYVTADTGDKTWNTQATQKSPWLSLVAGQRYYYEVLHLCPAGSSSDYVSVGYRLDSTGNSGNIPNDSSNLVPAAMLAPFDYPATVAVTGSLYITDLQEAPGANSPAVGYSYLRLTGSTAIVHYSYSGLTSTAIAAGIYGPGGTLLFDVNATDKFHPEQKTGDGGYTWNLDANALSALQNGTAYFAVKTALYPNGELNGYYLFSVGNQIAPADPTYLSWTDDSDTDAGVVRFLNQATFGASQADVNALKLLTPTGSINPSRYRTWLDQQLALAAPTTPNTHSVDDVLKNLSSNQMFPYPESLIFNSWWKNAISAPDQLRQRVAFALSEILVTSNQGPLNNNARILADYYDTLVDYGLPTPGVSGSGSFRGLLKAVTLTPAMGLYLDMLNNDKGDISVGRSANENYAREIMQLFSIGLYRLWPDGTLVLDAKGNPVPTYTQEEIKGLAKVFTGWTYGQALSGGRLPGGWTGAGNFLDPMLMVPTHHELGPKLLLDRVVLPPLLASIAATGQSSTSTGVYTPVTVQSLDPVLGPGHPVTSTITNDYDLYGLNEMDKAHDIICNRAEVGPFICRQLIQRLVTSNPQPAYVQRVVKAFNGERDVDGNATGVRGDMAAVIRAILLDYEARVPRNPSIAGANTDPTFGKQREPLMRVVGPARAFRPTPLQASYVQNEFSDPGTNSLNNDTMHLVTITTSAAHRLISGDLVLLDLPSGTGVPLTRGAYTVTYVDSTHFTIPAAGFDTGISWKQTNGVSDSSSGTVVTVTNRGSNNGYIAGMKVYLKFVRNGANAVNATPKNTSATDAVSSHLPADGAYVIQTATASTFTVAVASNALRTNASNTLIIPRFNNSGYTITRNGATSDPNDIVMNIATGVATNNLSYTGAVSGLAAGDHVWMDFPSNITPVAPADGEFTVDNIPTDPVTNQPDLDHFNVLDANTANVSNASEPSLTVYPLVKPPLTRSGTVTTSQSHYQVGPTGPPNFGELAQSPMNSPTVFNFFYPDFQYPYAGMSGMTVPEFQLTTDSNVVNLQNFITAGFFTASNTGGYASFRAGSGAVVMDFNSYSGADTQTVNGVNALIDSLNTLLCAGSLQSTTKDTIRNYILYSKTITAVTQASPAVFSMAGHGLVNGQLVYISGISGGSWTGASGTSAPNNAFYTVANVTTDTFTLKNGATDIACTNKTGVTFATPSARLFPSVNGNDVRDRIRMIVHLIVSSPEYAIQQ